VHRRRISLCVNLKDVVANNVDSEKCRDVKFFYDFLSCLLDGRERISGFGACGVFYNKITGDD